MFTGVGILQAVMQCILLILIGQHNEIGLNEKRSAISNVYLNHFCWQVFSMFRFQFNTLSIDFSGLS